MVPRLKCPTCERDATQHGLAYPHIDLESLRVPESILYQMRDGRAIPLKQHRELTSQLKAYVPPEVCVAPGVRFGRLRVDVRGDTSGADVFFELRWEMMVRSIVLEAIADAGIECLATPVECHGNDLFEITTVAVDALRDDARRLKCPTCNTFHWTGEMALPVSAHLIPKDLDFCKCIGWPWGNLLSPRVVKCFREAGVAGIEMDPVPL